MCGECGEAGGAGGRQWHSCGVGPDLVSERRFSQEERVVWRCYTLCAIPGDADEKIIR